MELLREGRYSWWQNVLASAFLEQSRGAFVFFVDEAELGRIAPAVDDPGADLASAVRGVSSHVPGAYFSNVDRGRRKWGLGDRSTPPPVLPVLALTVLAATRMRSDGRGLSTNYYVRLAETLAPEGTNEEVAAVREEVSGPAFLDVVDMWCALHEWVDAQNGRVGKSTIRTHARLNRIGYPRSQALLTRADRAGLTRFFRAMSIDASGPPDEGTLLRGLDIWTTARQNRLGDTFMAALRDEETRGLIGTVVRAFAGAWNGEVVTKDGRRRIPIKLGLDVEEWATEWLFPVEDGVPATVTLSGLSANDGPVRLTQRPPSRYFAAENAPPVVPATVRSGFRLQGGEFTGEFLKRDVVIFVADAQTGAWSSTSGITPYETHVLAAASAEADAVKRVLTQAAESGWAHVNQGRSALLPGFVVFENVRFVDSVTLEKALRDEPRLRLLGVAPTLVPRARFVRGLPLARELAPNHYLERGEPDLLLPTEDTRQLVPMSLGGVEDKVPVNGFPLELRRFRQPLGTTEVVADGQKLTFTLLSESPIAAPPRGESSLGWSDAGKLTTAAADHRIVGAMVDGAADEPIVVCRRGRDETWLLLDGGLMKECREPGQPSFTEGAGFAHEPAYFEVTLPVNAQWVAQRNGDIWNLTRLAPGMPHKVSASFDVLETWARGERVNGTSPYWELQIELADG